MIGDMLGGIELTLETNSVMLNVEVVFGDTHGSAAGLRITVKHSSNTSGIDKVGSGNGFVEWRMRMADKDEVVGEIMSQLTKPTQWGVGKKKLIRIIRASMKNMNVLCQPRFILAKVYG